MTRLTITIAIASAGFLGAALLVIGAAREPFSLFSVLILVWYAIPQLITVSAAFVGRDRPVPGWLSLVTALVVTAIGVGLPWKARFIDPPDAQAGIAFLFFPLLQLPPAILCLAVNVAFARREPMAHPPQRPGTG